MNTRKILFIDDEANILSSFKRMFHNSPYECFYTSDPEAALAKLSEEEYTVIVSDQRMPMMEGVEVLKRARELSPKTIRVMLTGYADIKSAIKAVNDGCVFRFLAKPWVESDLRSAIDESIYQFELVEENERLQALTKRQNQELTQFNEDLEMKVDQRTMEVTKLNDDLKFALFSTIKIMGTLSGIFDKRLEGHGRRVAKAAGFIARELGLTEKEMYEVQVASFLYNIGSLAGSSRSKSELSAEEVLLSAKIVSLIPNLDNVSLYVLHQLESYNGKGWPDQMNGNLIPIGSRIIAAVSFYDRLLHMSPSRPATPRVALAEVKTRYSERFDPNVLASLENYMEFSLRSYDEEIEQSMGIMELHSGMIASKPILSAKGDLLIARDIVITDELLERLWQRQLLDHSMGEIWVYKNSAKKKNAA